MFGDFQSHVQRQLDAIRAAGAWKAVRIRLADGREVLNLCANNYLGLAQHPEVRAAAHAALDAWGYGLAACVSSAARRGCTSSSNKS